MSEKTVEIKQNHCKKVTTTTFRNAKGAGSLLTMLTAYDYPSAMWADRAGVDAILVGDSLGMVVLGYENTLPVTMEEMLHHCRAVARGAKHPFLIGDMPFMSYQADLGEAVRNAGRFLKEAGMDAVKLEGGRERKETVRAIVNAGIPVVGHLGLTPQSVQQLGGFKPQGRDAAAAATLIEDAMILEDVGVVGLVLECIPDRLAELVTRRLSVPTIGVGAGPACDGQCLVMHDLLGLFERFTPRFAKRYANLNGEIHRALSQFVSEVKERQFPCPEHVLEMSDDEWRKVVGEG